MVGFLSPDCSFWGLRGRQMGPRCHKAPRRKSDASCGFLKLPPWLSSVTSLCMCVGVTLCTNKAKKRDRWHQTNAEWPLVRLPRLITVPRDGVPCSLECLLSKRHCFSVVFKRLRRGENLLLSFPVLFHCSRLTL